MGEPKPNGLKKKKRFVEYKPLVVGSTIAVLAIAGIVGGIFFYLNTDEDLRGTITAPYSGFWLKDPLLFGDPIMINQIAEGLFEYEITDEYTRIIPNLALEGIWSPDGLNLTCSLREGVKFHDGTPFNSTAVKWNFDRLQNLLNNISYPWIWYDFEGKLILNRTVIIDEYTIRFVLNIPFAPFKAMLCTSHSYILSPDITPQNDFIEIDTDIIGTGPFKYDSSTFFYDPIEEVYYTVNTTLLPNLDYWGGRPDIDRLVFKFIESEEERYQKMISGELQITNLGTKTPEDYASYSKFSLNYFNSTDIWQIAMRNDLINATMRKALSYSINYTKLISFHKSRYEGGALRSRSPLSKGMLYSNWEDFELPKYNLVIARQCLKDVNWNGTAGALTANDNITAGNEWESLVTNDTPLAIYNLTYVVTSYVHNFTASLLIESLKQIGVKINLIPATWFDIQTKISKSHFKMFAWLPDYNDPSSNINPLYSSKADGFENWGKVNDTLVQQWMEQGVIETNETIRAQLYYNIQKRLIEEVFPCFWGWTPVYCNIHGLGLRGINYNLIFYTGNIIFKDAYFE